MFPCRPAKWRAVNPSLFCTLIHALSWFQKEGSLRLCFKFSRAKASKCSMSILSLGSSFLKAAKCNRVDSFFYLSKERFNSGLSQRQERRSQLLLMLMIEFIGVPDWGTCCLRDIINQILLIEYCSSMLVRLLLINYSTI